jgi:hypothetical protein
MTSSQCFQSVPKVQNALQAPIGLQLLATG